LALNTTALFVYFNSEEMRWETGRPETGNRAKQAVAFIILLTSLTTSNLLKQQNFCDEAGNLAHVNRQRRVQTPPV
jgi:hypothetical protein